MGLLDRVGRFLDDVLLLPEDVRDALDTGDEALSAELFPEAERLFLDVLATRPGLGRAALGLARARAGMRDDAGALAALEEARTHSTLDPSVSLWAARLALDAGRIQLAADAARDASRALAEEGGARLAEACRLRAEAEWRRERPDRAVRELRKALSATPQDHTLVVRLVEASVAAGRAADAERAAESLDPKALKPSDAARMGLALARAGLSEPALSWLHRAADSGDATALIALAEGQLAAGRVDEAELHARSAIARGGGPKALATLADVLVAARRGAAAAEAVSAAAHGSGDVELHRGAIRVADPDDVAALTRYADALSRVAPGDPVEQLARGLIALAQGDVATAAQLDPGDEPRGVLLRAQVALRQGRPADALAQLESFPRVSRGRPHASVDSARVGELRKAALKASWTDTNAAEVDLAGAIDAVARFAEKQGLGDVARAARGLRDELDRPLLLAVLGEFNAGKSTLINAIIGAEVAPMGIVPTTATLNVLRGGAARRVRLVRVDGSTREGGYDALRDLLADAAAADETVDHVEIVLPSEDLERVWIMDAPGTNALDPAHEKLAREAARRADAVLWVFDASQAGKKTEASFYAAFRGSGRKVIPVLNKRDRLSEEDLERVSAVVRASWVDDAAGAPPGEPMGALVTVSGRTALKAKLAGDEAALAASGFEDFLAHLDREVFSRSRELKRRACASRLLAVLDQALETERELVEGQARVVARLNARAGRIGARHAELQDQARDAVRAVVAGEEAALEAAADELLSVLKPRGATFGRSALSADDQAFLGELLERRFTLALEQAERRLVAQVRGALAQAMAGTRPEDEQASPIDLDLRVRAALGSPFSAYLGYQRGLLRGGALRRLFEDSLPRAVASRQGAVAALGVVRADARGELGGSLRDVLAELVGSLERAVVAEAAAAEQHGEQLSSEVFGPLRALREVLAEMMRVGRGESR
ncbi:MAG: dynamin family protein [Myxococcales bacterium]|nr:dynamin family protein [Myxococcales bacterium]MCB9630454.1 dynamin family protein [Sandaracinaceae bacterium]